jgi:N6-L-threonylcarbamoyladenine synthase/protein kinase Bud32
VRELAAHLARLHGAGLVHGDPTPRNARVDDSRVFLVDFGLGYNSGHPEDHAMDLHVLAGSLAGTDDAADRLVAAARESYRETGDPAVLDRLDDIQTRGRYQ